MDLNQLLAVTRRRRHRQRRLALVLTLAQTTVVGATLAASVVAVARRAEPAVAMATVAIEDPAAPVSTTTRVVGPDVLEVPFEVRGDTRTSTTRRIDRYACGADIDEGGAEVWYTVRIDRSGWLELSLDDEPDGVDVDIHLLRTDAGDSCMARGHTRVYAAVEPGTYQVVADTYVRDGAERPGPFTLRGTLRP